MVKIYSSRAEFKKFLYPLCRSRVHELNLEELPTPISISDLNSVEEIDRIIKAFSEAIPKQHGKKNYIILIFFLVSRLVSTF